MLTLTELKERVIQEYDPDLLVEVLEITTEELLERFEDKFIENIESFEELT
jgi:hypothetical protein